MITQIVHIIIYYIETYRVIRNNLLLNLEKIRHAANVLCF